jgi:hypothetical protein
MSSAADSGERYFFLCQQFIIRQAQHERSSDTVLLVTDTLLADLYHPPMRVGLEPALNRRDVVEQALG